MTIKNGDMPAHPLTSPDLSLGANDSGLTKRERFAMAAMQGLLSGGYCIDSPKYRITDVPQEAVNLVDALLVELEKHYD